MPPRDAVVISNPPKLYLQDLGTLERLDAQFNPSSFDNSIRVNWTKQKIPGLSHQKFQYDNTENEKINLELIFDSFFTNDVSKLEDATRFIASLCYRKGDGSMSRFLVLWPNVLSLVCVIDGDLKFKTTRFNSNAARTYVTITLPLSEIRDTRLTSEDVRSVGLQRHSVAVEIPDGKDETGIA
jgi:hypothetical protein